MALLLQNVVLDEREPAAIAAEALGVPAADIVEAEGVRRGVDARARSAAVWRGNIRVELSNNEAGVLARNLPGVRQWSERDAVRRSGEMPARRMSGDMHL